MDKIKVGSEILDYSITIGVALESFVELQTNLNQIATTVAENYAGAASDEMNLFFNGLAGNVGKLSGLYYKVSQYMEYCYYEYIELDEAMAKTYN